MENDKDEEEDQNSSDSSWPRWLSIAFLAGFVLIFLGAFAVFVSAAIGSGSSSSSAGVVIFIGPFPIVFGSGPDAGLLILAAVIIAAISIALFAIFQRRTLRQAL